jgi:hypothetical protein
VAPDRWAATLRQETAKVDHGGPSLLGRGCLELRPIGRVVLALWSPIASAGRAFPFAAGELD